MLPHLRRAGAGATPEHVRTKLLHALAHHNLGVDPYEALDHLCALAGGECEPSTMDWVKEQIDALTTRLAEKP